MTRFFDIVFSLAGLILLSPLLLVITILVLTGSPGGAFYIQTRVGKGGRDFRLIKFRTMVAGADRGEALTVGSRDRRITRTGYFLRKYKLDELPQLINVLKRRDEPGRPATGTGKIHAVIYPEATGRTQRQAGHDRLCLDRVHP
jgi:lipopolysaccharide/colanic/teichoic acid biosynthesis glycosyltransferase